MLLQQARGETSTQYQCTPYSMTVSSAGGLSNNGTVNEGVEVRLLDCPQVCLPIFFCAIPRVSRRDCMINWNGSSPLDLFVCSSSPHSSVIPPRTSRTRVARCWRERHAWPWATSAERASTPTARCARSNRRPRRTGSSLRRRRRARQVETPSTPVPPRLGACGLLARV